jgi:hypothetical protein
MSEGRSLPTLLIALLLCSAPAAADPAVTLLDLPFSARALRGPGSEVAVAVATSGLMPRPKPASADPRAKATSEDAPVAVVWGEAGGAALTLSEGRLTTTPLGADAIDGLSASETPRGALPGARRALLGPLSAHLSRTGSPERTSLTIRERQPVAMSTEPKPVPVTTSTVSAGEGAGFLPRGPRAARIDGRPILVAVAAEAAGASSLVLVARSGAGSSGVSSSGEWAILARSPPQAAEAGGEPVTPAAIADFSGTGRPQVAAVRAPDGTGLLQVWAYEGGALSLRHEAPGYTDLSPGGGEGDLAALIDLDRDGVPELALPIADRSALAILSLKDGIRERARIPLPAPAAFGLAVLGDGPAARLLVGLADGRVAMVAP